MAKERLKSPRLRLFVALELPEAVREGLAAWQQNELTPIPVLRPVSPGALHVTLAFLGYRAERDVHRVTSILERVKDPAPTLRFEPAPVPVPPKRPRLFAAAAESEGTIALQSGLSEALEEAKLYEPEKRAFWPHVTLARARPERRGSKRPARVDVRPRALPARLLEPFESVRIALYRSILRPQGAEYVRLAVTELPPQTEADG